MTINLLVKIDLSTTEDAALIERALCALAYDALIEDVELKDPADLIDGVGFGRRVLAIIRDVEVTVR